MGRLKLQALREEVQRFDETDHSWTSAVRQRLCCTAAMHPPQQSAAHVGIPAPVLCGKKPVLAKQTISSRDSDISGLYRCLRTFPPRRPSLKISR